MSIPVGMKNKMPVGMMVMGDHFKEKTLIRAGVAFDPKQNQCAGPIPDLSELQAHFASFHPFTIVPYSIWLYPVRLPM